MTLSENFSEHYYKVTGWLKRNSKILTIHTSFSDIRIFLLFSCTLVSKFNMFPSFLSPQDILIFIFAFAETIFLFSFLQLKMVFLNYKYFIKHVKLVMYVNWLDFTSKIIIILTLKNSKMDPLSHSIRDLESVFSNTATWTWRLIWELS